MYLSCLLIDVGTNPDRPRPGRLWLRNRYRVHQRLCMAFPSSARSTNDADFLSPYLAEDFAAGDVHVARKTEAGFLFRVEPQPNGRVVVLVQSANKPDWAYAFGLKPGSVDSGLRRPVGNAAYLLAAPPSEPRPLQLNINVGARLLFRLLANPTKRLRSASLSAGGQPTAEKWVGKRVPVPARDLESWLVRRAEGCGFRVESLKSVQGGYIYVNRNGDAGKGQRLRSVRYDGLLEVTDVDRFRAVLIHGIGPGKAFGFGLLSVAPAG